VVRAVWTDAMSAGGPVTIEEAAALTGLTIKALRNRCDRGQLRFVKRGNVRRIPISELVRAGILEAPADQEAEAIELEDGATPRELVDRTLLAELGRAQEELGKLRAIAERSESTLREELEAERARTLELDRVRSELELELERVRGRSFLERIRNR
jgi:hypothetical protein